MSSLHVHNICENRADIYTQTLTRYSHKVKRSSEKVSSHKTLVQQTTMYSCGVAMFRIIKVRFKSDAKQFQDWECIEYILKVEDFSKTFLEANNKPTPL